MSSPLVNTSWNILVIEPDTSTFEEMERELQRQATGRDYNIRVILAQDIEDARIKQREYLPLVVSMEMIYPLKKDQDPSKNSSTEFVGFLTKKKIPYVIYTKVLVGAVSDSLLSAGYTMRTIPVILQKPRNSNYTSWASVVLDKVLERS